jgi:hypothetical protein
MQRPVCNCFICNSPMNCGDLHTLYCDCPHGSPVCRSCKNFDGQRPYVGATVFNYCSKSKGVSICKHSQPLKCSECSKSGRILSKSLYFEKSVQAWRCLQENQHLRRRSAFFAMMAEDWRMFSSFYYQNFCGMMATDPWTAEKKKAFFELWLGSQMRILPCPQGMIQLRYNLWDSYPRYPLFISRRFSWRFLQLHWSRLLVCKMSAAPNYKWLIMRIIVRYLTAQHAEICELTF